MVPYTVPISAVHTVQYFNACVLLMMLLAYLMSYSAQIRMYQA
jgi:hypothetical protein